MQTTADSIKKAIHKDFSKKYKAFGDFIDSGEIWDLCVGALDDTKLINNRLLSKLST